MFSTFVLMFASLVPIYSAPAWQGYSSVMLQPRPTMSPMMAGNPIFSPMFLGSMMPPRRMMQEYQDPAPDFQFQRQMAYLIMAAYSRLMAYMQLLTMSTQNKDAQNNSYNDPAGNNMSPTPAPMPYDPQSQVGAQQQYQNQMLPQQQQQQQPQLLQQQKQQQQLQLQQQQAEREQQLLYEEQRLQQEGQNILQEVGKQKEEKKTQIVGGGGEEEEEEYDQSELEDEQEEFEKSKSEEEDLENESEDGSLIKKAEELKKQQAEELKKQQEKELKTKQEKEKALKTQQQNATSKALLSRDQKQRQIPGETKRVARRAADNKLADPYINRKTPQTKIN